MEINSEKDMILGELLPLLKELDGDVLLAINGWHSEWADLFMFTFSGKWIWVPMYAAILFMVYRLFDRRTLLGCVIAIALTIVFADQVCSSVIRPLACQLRPSNLANPISEFVHIVNGKRGGTYGFPSCHAANTFGLAFFLFFLLRNRLLTAFMVSWALLTCYSRAYLGVHYPSDLIAGTAVGFTGAALMYFLFAKTFRYRRSLHYGDGKIIALPVLAGLWTVIGIAVYATVRATVGVL